MTPASGVSENGVFPVNICRVSGSDSAPDAAAVDGPR